MNKIIIIFATVSMLFSFEVLAQQHKGQDDRRERHFDREAFEAKRIAFITTELKLTPKEAAEFIPLCNELRQKRFELGFDCRKSIRDIERKREVADEDYIRSINECLEADIRSAELEKEYYEQFKKVLSPEKIFKYREAEHKFARMFVQDLEEKR
jgi:hypothetical protein